MMIYLLMMKKNRRQKYTSHNNLTGSMQTYVRHLKIEIYHLKIHILLKMESSWDNKQICETIVL